MIMRMMCGTTRPTKAMIPQNATAADTSRATTAMTMMRSRSTLIPTWRALFSPSDRMSRPGARVWGDDDPEHDEREDQPDLGPQAAVEAAHLPEHDLLPRRGGCGEGDVGDRGPGDGVDRHTREHERDHLRAPSGAGDRVDDEGGDQPADEGEGRGGERAEEGPAEQDRGAG